ncbi:hypothetical protein [Gracilibacillus thailandensis]|uniref:Uncharacterized protein n=1 Tax=Gracilibacillus thailandensis TaxID=563735 RepID=A0A6N7QYB4_9BACI|nr:hypothetical protein [Gracilibacillus thailandensis]MRI66192.1 hypothetical protein [Gracilibacillus thailandensis]
MKVGKSVKKGYNELSERAKKILLVAMIILSIFFLMGFIVALPMLMFFLVICIQIGIPILFAFLAYKLIKFLYHTLKGKRKNITSRYI